MTCTKKEEKKEMEEGQKIITFEKGEIVKLSELLFTPERDHLIKYNSDEKVRVFTESVCV